MYLLPNTLRPLNWGTDIDNITKKANQTLGFLKRNIKVHNQDLKPTAYKTLIRPQLEYASTVWSTHTATDIYKLESVQCRAAGGLLVNTGKTLALPQCLETSTGVDQRHI